MKLKSINIKGKDYVLINERVKCFVDNYMTKGYKYFTEQTYFDGSQCSFKCTIVDADNNVVSTGHAWESRDKNQIDKFAFVENCETSAVGRALAFLGIGIDTAICSAQELQGKMGYEDKHDYKYYVDQICFANDVKSLGRLWYQWKDTEFAKELQKVSNARKLQLENPTMVVDIASTINKELM